MMEERIFLSSFSELGNVPHRLPRLSQTILEFFLYFSTLQMKKLGENKLINFSCTNCFLSKRDHHQPIAQLLATSVLSKIG